MTEVKTPSDSFRDPDGFVFERDGVFYRRIEASYREDYEQLVRSGLMDGLVQSGLLTGHEEMPAPDALSPGAWKVLKHERLPFISYSYEWCFGQLKEAALLTLDIQKRALAEGMSLKDACTQNVQFSGGRAVWIDTLSFERFSGGPWPGYQQFCRHFLAPLALAARDLRFLQVPLMFSDGIPLDFASRLLPVSSWLDLHLLFHIHGNARTSKAAEMDGRMEKNGRKLTVNGLQRIVEHLRQAVEKISFPAGKSVWSDYLPEEHYGGGGFREKEKIVREWLAKIRAARVLDLGANTGHFSAMAAGTSGYVAALDFDPAVAEVHWTRIKNSEIKNVLPLVADLAQPVPGRGWENRERKPLEERISADLALVLGMVHHLALAAGIPLEKIAGFLARLAKQLIVEFVPETDPKAQELGARKKNAFLRYGQSQFERAFQEHFRILETRPVPGTGRILYRMEA